MLPPVLKKTVAVITLFSYLLTQVERPAHAMSAQVSAPSAAAISREPAAPFQIPQKLGRVESFWSPSQTHDLNTAALALKQPEIILIQDAHGQWSAQKNTRRLLHYLAKQAGIRAIFLEGAAGRQDEELLRFFKQPYANKRAAEWLMHEGEIGGAEPFPL